MSAPARFSFHDRASLSTSGSGMRSSGRRRSKTRGAALPVHRVRGAYGVQNWRVNQFMASCKCWQVLDSVFKKPFA